MANTEPKVVEIRELRFKPANSNDRARAGLEHSFRDVPPCSFAKGDGISHYLAADSGIDDHPRPPADHRPIHDNVPEIRQDADRSGHSLGARLLRSGFALSVFLHASAALAIGYLTIPLPDHSALLEGETVVAVEFFSETESEVTTRVAQDEQDGEQTDREIVETKPDEPVEKPVERKEEPPTESPVQAARPADPVRPVETAEQPAAVKAAEEAAAGSNVADVLATDSPSAFQVEAAARQILSETQFDPLPAELPDMLATPPTEQKPEQKLAQPLPHPVSKPKVVERVAEAKPVAKPVEKPIARKEEPKPAEKKPEPKKEPKKAEPRPEKKVVQKAPDEKPVKKKRAAQQGNADTNSDKGTREAKNRRGASQDASQGGSKKNVKGNAAFTNYKGLVERKLSRSKKRVDAGGRGKVEVKFTIRTDGSLAKLRVSRSSGKPAIDRAALEVVRKAAPFPAIPPESGLTTYEPTLPLTFK